MFFGKSVFYKFYNFNFWKYLCLSQVQIKCNPSIFIFFLGFLYKYQHNEKIKNVLSVLSWIHICFQPLFVNIFMSNFSQNKTTYWNIVFIISFLYGIYTLTTLKELDIQNDPDCIKKDKNDDFCSKHTTSYLGRL